MQDYDQVLRAQGYLGDKAADWWASELGQYIVGCSQREVLELRNKLEVIDPSDEKGIRKLQNDIQIAKKAVGWLDQMITEGQQADQQLQTLEDLKDAE